MTASVPHIEPASPLEGPRVPAWFPAWARKLADLYFSGTTCLFVLHGNVHDLIATPRGEETTYLNLQQFLGTQLFGSWDVVLGYDLGRGLRPLSGENGERLQSMMQHLIPQWGEAKTWPREPDKVLPLIEQLVERNLLADKSAAVKRIGVILDYAQYLIPTGDINALARGQAAHLVRLLSWAQNPYIKRVNTAFCLIADNLQEVNERLVQSSHVATIEIPLPTADDRRQFAASVFKRDDLSAASDFSPEQVAEMSSGLSLVNLNVLLSQVRGTRRRLDADWFKQLKKTLIERQCGDLLEFIEPNHTLDLVVGQAAAKERLREDAKWIGQGRLDAAPMGYLICGAVGTGKTFLAECYAGSIGIPCVKLRNFRSKYVGETEGNLERVLNVLRSLGPVVVMIDEADAALGSRTAEGDSGTSARVFSMIASQMGDTRYRGKIIWMLLTCRPDLLPIDLKRQGRAEVHIPMFYPQDQAELNEMFRVMARKNKLDLPAGALPDVSVERHLSGADIESIMLAAKRRVLGAGRTVLEPGDLDAALASFIPSAQGLEKELQEIAAVLECTETGFLPAEWRKKVAQPNGRTQLQERLVAIRQLLEE